MEALKKEKEEDAESKLNYFLIEKFSGISFQENKNTFNLNFTIKMVEDKFWWKNYLTEQSKLNKK